MASKASQDQAETNAIPRADMPTACERLEAWVLLASLQPGEPVFRAVDQWKRVTGKRERWEILFRCCICARGNRP
jgi:hypothetical protein